MRRLMVSVCCLLCVFAFSTVPSNAALGDSVGGDFGAAILSMRDSRYSLAGGLYMDLTGPTSKTLTWRVGADWVAGYDDSEGLTDESYDFSAFDFRASAMWFFWKPLERKGGFYLGGGPTAAYYDQTVMDENTVVYWYGEDHFEVEDSETEKGSGFGGHAFIGYEGCIWHIEVMYEVVSAEYIDLGGLWMRVGVKL